MATINEDPLIGTVLGARYLITGKLGEGGMGMVYEAEQQSNKRRVALKVLHPNLCRDHATRARFQVEAEVASRLNHPNSVTVLDFGEIDGLFFLAMEFIAGNTLSRVIEENGPIEWRRSIHISKQICGSLQDAHDHHIIHRDLKSENIMLLESNQSDFVKVLDFGIAKILEADGTDQLERLTKTGMVLGTPKYMSPEQIRGEKLDLRTDIYSLGVILYEMLAGRLPFDADSPMGMLTRHLHDPVAPISSRNPDVNIPPLLEKIVLKALAKKREQRQNSMMEFSSELEQVLESTVSPTNDNGLATKSLDIKKDNRSQTLPTPERKNRSVRVALIFAVLVIVLVSGAILGWRVLSSNSVIGNALPPFVHDKGNPGAGQGGSTSGPSNVQILEPDLPMTTTCSIKTDDDSLSQQIAGLLSSRLEYIESCAIYENLNAPLQVSFAVKPRSSRLSNLRSSISTNTNCLVSILYSEDLKRAPKSKQTGFVFFDFAVEDRSLKRCRIQIDMGGVESTTGSFPPGNESGDTDDVEAIPIQDLLPDPETVRDKLEWIKNQIKKGKPDE